MKLKTAPEDFVVTELARWEEDPEGDYRIYRVRKRKMTTFEAIDLIRDHTGAEGEALTYAGLKDRQAVAVQHVALRGLELRGKIPGLRCDLVGRARHPLTSRHLLGNRFEIIVRELDHASAGLFCGRAREVAEHGLPNYFGEQRFGNIRAGQAFLARELILGRHEEALRLLLATPGRFDPPADVARKQVIARLWGNWRLIAEKVRGGPHPSILRDLARHPGDYAGALDRMPARTRAIHMLSYQAYIWNEAVTRYLGHHLPHKGLLEAPYCCDRFVFWKPPRGRHRAVLNRLKGLSFPLIDHESKLEDPDIRLAIDSVLVAEGIPRREFRAKGVPSAFFKEVPRALILEPEDLTVSEVEADEKNRGKARLRLAFTLPPGAYATLVLSRIFSSRPYDPDHQIDRTWIEGHEPEPRPPEPKKPKKTKKKPRQAEVAEEPEVEAETAVRAVTETAVAAVTEAAVAAVAEAAVAADAERAPAAGDAPESPDEQAPAPKAKKRASKKDKPTVWKGLDAKRARREARAASARRAEKSKKDEAHSRERRRRRRKARKEKRAAEGSKTSPAAGEPGPAAPEASGEGE